jgi:hypothetical protein
MIDVSETGLLSQVLGRAPKLGKRKKQKSLEFGN